MSAMADACNECMNSKLYSHRRCREQVGNCDMVVGPSRSMRDWKVEVNTLVAM